jgi:hypothetical protein
MQPRHRVDEQCDGDGCPLPELGQRLRLLCVDRAEYGDEQTVAPPCRSAAPTRSSRRLADGVTIARASIRRPSKLPSRAARCAPVSTPGPHR